MAQDYDVTLYTQLSLYAMSDIANSGSRFVYFRFLFNCVLLHSGKKRPTTGSGSYLGIQEHAASPFSLLVNNGVVNKSIFPFLPSAGITLSPVAKGVVGYFFSSCFSFF
jgi:hypothetical protein